MTEDADIFEALKAAESQEAEIRRLKRDAAHEYIEKFERDPNSLIVRRLMMGRTQSFIGSAPLSWVARNVKFFQDLPSSAAFKQDGDLNLRIEFEDMSHRLQRNINHSRQFEMVKYFIENRNHKFPPLLLVLRAGWEDDPLSDHWNQGRAERSSANFQPMGTKDTDLGALSLFGSEQGHLFAIDGQHRLNAIRGLDDLCGHRDVHRLTATGGRTTESISRAQLQAQDPQRYTDSFFNEIMEESIGFEIICNVNLGETASEARSRLRGVFRDVNMPRPLQANDGKVIGNPFFDVAQEAIISGDHLKGYLEPGKQCHFIKADSGANLTAKDKFVTTAAAVAGVAQRFLQYHEKMEDLDWNSSKDRFVEPPSAETVKVISALAAPIFKLIDGLPSVNEVKSGGSPITLREFGKGEEYLLLRPVAQEALADAAGQLVYRDTVMTPKQIAERLEELEKGGHLSGLGSRKSPWFGLFTKLNAKGGVAMVTSFKKHMPLGLKYFLGGGHTLIGKERETLLKAWRDGRRRAKGSDQVFDWDGEKSVAVADLELPQLP